MTSSTTPNEPHAVDVSVTDEEPVVSLDDGRRICAPLAWFPRLLHADEGQRLKWELSGGGLGIHWPDVDEDLSVRGLLAGTPARGTPSSLHGRT